MRSLNSLRIGPRAVGRGVVHDDNFKIRSLLPKNRFQTAADIPVAIKGDDRHANLWDEALVYESVISKTPVTPRSTTLNSKSSDNFSAKNFG